jgi:hypothetical protein
MLFLSTVVLSARIYSKGAFRSGSSGRENVVWEGKGFKPASLNDVASCHADCDLARQPSSGQGAGQFRSVAQPTHSGGGGSNPRVRVAMNGCLDLNGCRWVLRPARDTRWGRAGRPHWLRRDLKKAQCANPNWTPLSQAFQLNQLRSWLRGSRRAIKRWGGPGQWSPPTVVPSASMLNRPFWNVFARHG